MFGDNLRERTIGTDGVAPARLPDNWGGYLAGKFVSGQMPIDRQVQPNSPLPSAPAGQVQSSGWHAWVTARRRALGGRD
jgi:hypothetical protein